MTGEIDLAPETLVEAYCRGVFPMADQHGKLGWFTADPRGIIPVDSFHVPHTLSQFMRSPKCRFEVHINRDFEGTMRACMTARGGATWITPELIDAYVRLHRLGFAHSVETWLDGKPVGGLYGVSLGGAFFGESMYHTETDASKVALVHLVGRLKERGYELLDAQASTEHLRRFGCIEIPAREYLRRLSRAVQMDCSFV